MILYQLCGNVFCKNNNKSCQCTIGYGLKEGYEGMDGVEDTGDQEFIKKVWDGCSDHYEEDVEFAKNN